MTRTPSLFNLLHHEHVEIKEPLQRLVSTFEHPARQFDYGALEEVCLEIAHHMQLEEKCLYSLMRTSTELKDLAEEATLEHMECKRLIKQLGHPKTLSHSELKVKVTHLQLLLESHIEAEETVTIPRIQETLPAEAIRTLVKQMEAFKLRPVARHKLTPV